MGIQQLLAGGGATMSASASPTTISGGCGSPGAGNCSATTSAVTVTVLNGSGSYSLSWNLVSGTAAGPNTPTLLTTTFSRSGAKLPGGNNISGTYECVVTDTVTGQVATTNTFNVNTTHTDTT